MTNSTISPFPMVYDQLSIALDDQLSIALDLGNLDTRELIEARWEARYRVENEATELAPEDRAELNLIVEQIDEIEAVVGDEFGHGCQLVRENHFEEHARELAEETGAVDPHAPWPMNCIDWEQAADELRGDYSSVEIAGATYYFRG
jgi:hypothetical protein